MITIAIYLISLFVNLSPEPLNDVEGFKSILILTKSYPASERASGTLLTLSILFTTPETSNATFAAGPDLSISS